MIKMTQDEWEKSIERVGVVAGCVIKQDGRYLLVQEKQSKVYGLWNIPAGHANKGETIEQAAVREVEEESGYKVELKHEIGIYHESIPLPIKHVFAAEITGGFLRIQEDEILNAKWFAFDEVQALNKKGKLRADWLLEVISKLEK